VAIEIGLRTLLLAQASITALAPAQTVGGVSFDAVFLDNAAEGVKPPYVIITQTGHDPYKRLDGTGGTLRKTEVDSSRRPVTIHTSDSTEQAGHCGRPKWTSTVTRATGLPQSRWPVPWRRFSATTWGQREQATRLTRFSGKMHGMTRS